MKLFAETRHATLEDISWLRKALGRRLSELRLAQGVIDDLQLVLCEIATNAIVHADPAPTRLGVAVELIGAGLALEITDDGGEFSGFDAAFERKGTGARTDAFSGRGLALVRDALDRAQYRSLEVNRFTGWKSLRAPRPTVLVVEDAPTLLEIYCEYLRKEYRTLGCGSLQEAHEILASCHIDVVLADYHLGDGMGASLANRLEIFGQRAAPPVVLISADLSPETRESAMRLGAELFVQKPVRRAVLLDTITLAMNRSAARDARLAHSFAREVNGLVAHQVPGTICDFEAGVTSGRAETGGGDFILRLPLPGRERIVLVDVMGHGVTAKAWSIAYAAIIRTITQCRPDLGAGEFLTQLATFAWTEQSLEQAMATVLVADFTRETVRIASAGHPAPLIIGRDLRQIDVGGPLLGVLPPQTYEACDAELRVGERLIMFTDGIDPAEVAAGGAIPEWLQKTLLRLHNLRFEPALQMIHDAAERALGLQPADDWLIALFEKF